MTILSSSVGVYNPSQDILAFLKATGGRQLDTVPGLLIRPKDTSNPKAKRPVREFQLLTDCSGFHYDGKQQPLSQLVALNEQGWGVYLHHGDATGISDALTVSHGSFFFEWDDVPIEEQQRRLSVLKDWGLEPSFVYFTGGKSLQVYFTLDAPIPARTGGWKELMVRLINIAASDPAVKAEKQLMRLPGFKHNTIINNQLVQQQGEIWLDSGKVYTLAEFTRAIERLEEGKISFAPPKKSSTKKGNTKTVEVGSSTLDQLLALLDDSRFDDRASWSTIGFAIYNATGGSEEGLALFDKHSQRTTLENYGGCEAFWYSIKESCENPITIATLWGLAIEDCQDSPDKLDKLRTLKLEGLVSKLTYPRNLTECSPYISQDVYKQRQGRLICIKAAMGSGKNHSVIQPIASQCTGEFLVCSHRIALNDELAAKTGGNNISNIKDIKDLKNLVCCPDSLLRLVDRKPETIFIDEATQVLDHILFSETLRELRPRIIAALRQYGGAAKEVIITDAYLDDFTVKWFQELFKVEDKDIWVYENTHKGRQRFVKSYLDGEKVFNLFIGAVVHGERSILAVDNMREARRVAQMLDGHKVLLVTSQTRNQPEVKAFLRNANRWIEANPGYSIIYSPTINSGVSIEVGNFKAVYGVFSGVIKQKDALQMMGRYRPAAPWHIHFAKRAVGIKGLTDAKLEEESQRQGIKALTELSALMIQSLCEEKLQESSGYYHLISAAKALQAGLYKEGWLTVAAEAEAHRVNSGFYYQQLGNHLLREDGHMVEFEELKAAKGSRKARIKVDKAKKLEHAKKLLAMPCPSQAEFEELTKRHKEAHDLTIEDQDKRWRYRLEHEAGIVSASGCLPNAVEAVLAVTDEKLLSKFWLQTKLLDRDVTLELAGVSSLVYHLDVGDVLKTWYGSARDVDTLAVELFACREAGLGRLIEHLRTGGRVSKDSELVQEILNYFANNDSARRVLGLVKPELEVDDPKKDKRMSFISQLLRRFGVALKDIKSMGKVTGYRIDPDQERLNQAYLARA